MNNVIFITFYHNNFNNVVNCIMKKRAFSYAHHACNYYKAVPTTNYIKKYTNTKRHVFIQA